MTPAGHLGATTAHFATPFLYSHSSKPNSVEEHAGKVAGFAYFGRVIADMAWKQATSSHPLTGRGNGTVIVNRHIFWKSERNRRESIATSIAINERTASIPLVNRFNFPTLTVWL